MEVFYFILIFIISIVLVPDTTDFDYIFDETLIRSQYFEFDNGFKTYDEEFTVLLVTRLV